MEVDTLNHGSETSVLVVDFEKSIDELEARFLRRILMLLAQACNIPIDESPVHDAPNSTDSIIFNSSGRPFDVQTAKSSALSDEFRSSGDTPETQTRTGLVVRIKFSHSDNFPSHFSSIINGISSLGRKEAANVLRHVLELCLEDQELGGLQLRRNRPLTEADETKVLFLVEAWLMTVNTAGVAKEELAPIPSSEPTDIDTGGLKSGRRPMTLSEKIIAHHALSRVSSEGVKPGDVVRLSVDWVVASEVSWLVNLLSHPKRLSASGRTCSSLSFTSKHSPFQTMCLWLAD